MKFYNREIELQKLNEVDHMSQDSAQMSFVVGRRRIGKTSLLVKSCQKKPFLYFFVAKKNEALLCAEYVEEIKQKLEVPVYGEIKRFEDLFGFLLELSKTRHFTVIIDEFQTFLSVNPSVFSAMQKLWDEHKEYSSINLILCGSVYALMSKIFENAKEPLFGRATHRIHLKAFNITTLKTILEDYHPNYSAEDLMAFYLFTGGVAKYVELLVQAEAFTFNSILEVVIAENSLFIEEGKHVLIDEFGKDYGNYFSILTLIASGKTAREEIESIMEMQTGGFLGKLEKDYGLIKRVRPVFAKPNSRSVKYFINDNFLRFWFRFIYKNNSAIEINNFDYVKALIIRDYKQFSGKTLEKYFQEKLQLENDFNRIGTYWERKNQNEIDIVATNDLKKHLLIAEVKRDKQKIKLGKLKTKAERLRRKFSNYQIEYRGLSMTDM